jgi:hypothetical protein
MAQEPRSHQHGPKYADATGHSPPAVIYRAHWENGLSNFAHCANMWQITKQNAIRLEFLAALELTRPCRLVMRARRRRVLCELAKWAVSSNLAVHPFDDAHFARVTSLAADSELKINRNDIPNMPDELFV